MASAMLMLSWSGSPYLTLAKLFSDGINDPPVVLIVLANLALLFSPCLYVVLLRQDDGYRGLRIGSLFLGILGLLSYPFMGGLLSFQLFSTVTLLPGYYLILSWLAFSMVLNFVMSAGECRRGLRRLLLGRPPKNRAAA